MPIKQLHFGICLMADVGQKAGFREIFAPDAQEKSSSAVRAVARNRLVERAFELDHSIAKRPATSSTKRRYGEARSASISF
jgi:hypothetical protein